MLRHGVRLGNQGPPEVGDKTIGIVQRGDLGRFRRGKQYRRRTAERLHVVLHVAKSRPNARRDTGLAAEPGKGCHEIRHIARLVGFNVLNASRIARFGQHRLQRRAQLGLHLV